MGAAGIAMSQQARAEPDVAALPAVVAALHDLTADLFRQLAVRTGNLVCSPYSVAAALAMARAGARGPTASEIDHVLHAPPLAQLNSGANALAQHLEGLAGEHQRADRTTATVSLASANSLWGQAGIGWEREFLDTLAINYGAGLQLVDYATDLDGARRAINAWTGVRTAGRIPELVPAGALDALTRLVLVNAIYLKAPWEEPFDAYQTEPADFVRADGSRVSVPMMRGLLRSARHASGPGWRGVDLPYAGSQLAMAVIVPDHGRLAALHDGLDGPALRGLLTRFRPEAVALSLPRWTFRTQVELAPLLGSLGMPTAFTSDADFSGMTTQEDVFIGAALHEAFIAVDEEGTEAAAATAMVMRTVSAPASPVPVTVDRPFLFVVHDVETATPLFMGRVDDPTQTGS